MVTVAEWVQKGQELEDKVMSLEEEVRKIKTVLLNVYRGNVYSNAEAVIKALEKNA